MEYLKDFRLVLPLSLQGVDVGFDGRSGFGGGSDSRGLGFSGANVLGARVGSGRDIPGVVAFVGTVAFLPAAEAKSFFDASRSFRRGELREGNSINVHGIRVMSSSGGMDGRGKASPFQCEDAHLLSVKYFGLFNPSSDGGGYGGHGKNHRCELLVKS